MTRTVHGFAWVHRGMLIATVAIPDQGECADHVGPAWQMRAREDHVQRWPKKACDIHKGAREVKPDPLRRLDSIASFMEECVPQDAQGRPTTKRGEEAFADAEEIRAAIAAWTEERRRVEEVATEMEKYASTRGAVGAFIFYGELLAWASRLRHSTRDGERE